MRARLIATIAAAPLLLGFVAVPAQAAAPDTPILVSPANGSTASGTSIPLSVTATDPDGDGLDVRFEGRKAGTTTGPAASPFTVVVVPDTQSYTYGGFQGLMTQQTQWVVNSRPQLNTAMVVGLGDLVETYTDLTEWGYANTSQAVLDNAGVPNSVLPGNHDMNNATGDAVEYNTYFPPTRYLGKVFSPTTATYGGYLGENLFGPDPIDRKNMDNFFLFTGGANDFLVLNLEWEAPQYALDWATKVLAAYPNRTAILATHSFLQISGGRNTAPERPGGTSQTGLWNFVAGQCAIKLVVAGHVHNGDLGETRRTDNNQCGQPVQQLVSDYQSRANGGNGWLRYYTFDPAADTMTGVTYSPVLNQYETDADSSFTLPFTLADAAPAPFTTIATTHISSGGTATATWTGLDPATSYEWRAVATDGTGTSTSSTWTVSTPSATPTELARDTFTRTASRWGTAEVGGAWTDSGSAYFSTDGSYGQVSVAKASSGPAASLNSVSVRDLTLTTDFALASAPTGGTFYHQTTVRVNGTTFYQLAARVAPGGALALDLSRSVTGASTALGSVTLASFGYTAGERLRVRLDAIGASPTSLQAKVWRASASEPASPQLTATDSTAGLQVAGSVALKFYTGSGTTSLPTRVSVDGFSVFAPGTTPPVNQPPVAAFSATMKSWKVSVDASASSDDGSIASYAWDYGDGATGTGKTASHVYTADGTYPVKLTVTDNQGLATPLTKQVTVSNTAPVASFTMTSTGLTVALDASASADDGTITGYAWDYGDGASGTGRTATHTYPRDGNYPITLTVTDDTGKTGVWTTQFGAANPPPVPAFSATTKSWTVSVDASASTDDGTITGYSWDWGELGSNGSGKTASHTYVADGTYTITLLVTDNQGGSASLTKQVTVSNTAPTASFTATATSRTVAVDASASTDDGSITGYAWDYGDGATGTGRTATHPYAADGSYTVTLTVTDDTGRTGVTTQQVAVADPPPVPAFGATTKSWQVSVDASASTDDGTITGYAWDYGDGATATGKTASHGYTADGTYAVKLTVTDNQGVAASLTKQVTVSNTPPTAAFTATATGLDVALDASASADDGSIAGYAWSYGDGANGTGKTPTHTYAADGTYTIALTVTDDTGKTGTTSKQVSVAKPTATPIAQDGFGRTLPSSWGSADTGGAWTITSTTMFSVSGSRGLITIPAGGKGPIASLNAVSARDISIVTDFGLDKAPTGGPYTHQVMARMSGTTSWYHLVARVETNGSVTLELGKVVSGTSTTLKSVKLSGVTFAAGDRLKLRLDVVGTGTTSLAAKVWRATNAEPATATLSATDTAASLQGAGAVGIKAYASSAMSNVPVQVSVTGFTVTTAGV